MQNHSKKELAKIMRDLDFCMMLTTDGRGTQHCRPMSNNRNVDFDGDNWFFAYDHSNKSKQIMANPAVSLIFQKDMTFIHVYGKASILHQKSMFEQHWDNNLNQWFPEGTETKGLCLIHLKVDKAHYWNKQKEETINY